VLPRADRVLCVSPDDAAAVRAAGGRPLLAPNGVDDAFFAVPDGAQRETALFFGHFGYDANRRGLERFVAEGWPEVRVRRPRARLAVAGGGLEPALRVRLEATPGVNALGLVEDLPGVLAGVRAVVVPIWEGGGTRLKVLEALAAARPVVSTPLGASGWRTSPRRWGGRSRRCWAIRRAPRRWARRGARWPSASAGPGRWPRQRRFTASSQPDT
jgi:polysaccharide biosynthesis protein PslH